jgi:DeoR/GlpR family transcriptional regulator of sugar metabolism
MLAAQRHHLILQALEAEATVRVAALAELLNVSEMTVRRDIDALHAEGRLLRVHGGAARAGSFSGLEPGFARKSVQELDAKRAIAWEALQLLQPGMTLLVSAGTTTFELARMLPPEMDLTVATNSIMVANALARSGDEAGRETRIRTLVLGGQRTPSEALVGPLTTRAIRSLHADLCLMGIHGLDATAGITSPNLLEAEANTAMIAASERLTVLADSSKCGLVSLATIAPLSDITTLIIDSGIADADAEALRAVVGDVRIAPLPAAAAHPPGSTPPSLAASPSRQGAPHPRSKGHPA